ncbi:hypothetical protein FRC09_003771 [Ceratobasidium sp. 395]|nr:hypothetical protein FRC09_003771 [Ceratobasidium sp. 395]
MSPPEQSNRSKDKTPSDISKHLISIEYKGRRAVIRRSAHYDVTISSVKKAFKDLRNVNNDDIVLSAFLKEFDNTVEVPEESWPTVLPEIKSVTILVLGLVQRAPVIPQEENVRKAQSKLKPKPKPKSDTEWVEGFLDIDRRFTSRLGFLPSPIPLRSKRMGMKRIGGYD